MKKLKSFLSFIPGVLAAESTWFDPKGDEPARIEDITVIAERILNIFLSLAGLAAFVMIIVGGFQYLTAGNDPKKTQAAGQTITFAIFGLVAVIAAWFILLFIEKFTGVDVSSSFKILDFRKIFEF